MPGRRSREKVRAARVNVNLEGRSESESLDPSTLFFDVDSRIFLLSFFRRLNVLLEISCPFVEKI